MGMAPTTINASDMELHEPSITKPSPLRIIKRSQTLTSCSSPREIDGRRGRGMSESSYSSKGSPPMGPDRPLTIHKLRKKVRASVSNVLDGPGDDWSSSSDADNRIQDLIQKYSVSQDSRGGPDEDDAEATPKAQRKVSRSMSAGAFLRSQYFHGDSDDEGSPRSRTNENAIRSPNSPPKIPKRRLSKSKNFLLKAIGGRTTVEPTPESDSSKDGLCEIEEQDISDVQHNPRISDDSNSSQLHGRTTSYSAISHDAYVLYPRIKFTPEVTGADSGRCSMWVAIEVTGTLQRPTFYGQSMESIPPQEVTPAYGELYDIRVELLPGRDCVVEEIFGDLHELKCLISNETFLILAKVRLYKVQVPSSHIKESSDELIAELENHLGDTLTQYLTVRLEYHHSGFLDRTNDSIHHNWTSDYSTCLHYTSIHTEASAVIKRINLQSAWSPRTSRTVNRSDCLNPIISLIETHLPKDERRDAIARLASERVPIPLARRHGPRAREPSTEETMRANEVASTIDSAVSMFINQSKGDRPSTPESLRILQIIDSAAEAEVDPARKIWLHMRKTSRPNQKRRSITGASQYFTPPEIGDIPRPKSTGVSESGGQSMHTSISPWISESCDSEKGGNCGPNLLEPPEIGRDSIDHDIDQERSRIREIALSNKRSVGADTLRSMAPSKNGSAKGTTSTIGLALGGARGWVWGPPWW